LASSSAKHTISAPVYQRFLENNPRLQKLAIQHATITFMPPGVIDALIKCEDLSYLWCFQTPKSEDITKFKNIHRKFKAILPYSPDDGEAQILENKRLKEAIESLKKTHPHILLEP
jgi:hypothetical protein